MEVMDSGDIFLVGGFFMGRWGSNGRTGYYHTWVVKCLYNPLGPPKKKKKCSFSMYGKFTKKKQWNGGLPDFNTFHSVDDPSPF